MRQAKEGVDTDSVGANANPISYVDRLLKSVRGCETAHSLITLSLSTRSLAKIRCISAPTSVSIPSAPS